MFFGWDMLVEVLSCDLFGFTKTIFFPKIAGLNLTSKSHHDKNTIILQGHPFVGFRPTWFWRVYLVPPT